MGNFFEMIHLTLTQNQCHNVSGYYLTEAYLFLLDFGGIYIFQRWQLQGFSGGNWTKTFGLMGFLLTGTLIDCCIKSH